MDIAVFLDRDGVIIQEPPHYAHRPDQMKLIPRSAEAIKLLNDNKFKIIVITNQSGIARGYFKEKDVIQFNQLMTDKLRLSGANLDAIYYCPHLPDAIFKKYRTDCECRKPNSGMLKKAEKDLNIDLRLSFIIGDKETDLAAGRNVGCKTILVLTGHGADELINKKIESNFIAKDLFEAVQYILS